MQDTESAPSASTLFAMSAMLVTLGVSLTMICLSGALLRTALTTAAA